MDKVPRGQCISVFCRIGAYPGFHDFERGGGGSYFRDVAPAHDASGDILVVPVVIPYHTGELILRMLLSPGRVSVKIAPSFVDCLMIPTGMIMLFSLVLVVISRARSVPGQLTLPEAEDFGGALGEG